MNAVVTGGSKGIGRAVTLKLLSDGYDVAICSRNLSDLQDFKKEVSVTFPDRSFFVFKTDASQKQEVKKFALDVAGVFDRIDVLVNNVGVFLPGETLIEDEGNLEKMMDTNVYSAYYLTRGLIAKLIEAKGHIVNICSIASKVAYPGGGSYSITKFAMYGFNQVLREELKPKGVRVTAILPGATWSNSWEGVDLPKDRLMLAGDIAKVVSACIGLDASADVEEVVVRPQLGDL